MPFPGNWTDPSASPPDLNVDDTVSAGAWDAMLGDLQHLGGATGTTAVLVAKTADQSIANTTLTRLTWQAENYDTNSLRHPTTNTERLTANELGAEVGLYLVSGVVVWAANVTGCRQVRLYVNGVAVNVASHATTASGLPGTAIMDILTLVGGDYVELFAYQDSGGNLAVSAAYSHFEMFRISRLT